MSMSFQRIAYEALEVCNGVTMAAVEAAVAAAGLPSGTLALDIGTGNAGVAIRLAEAQVGQEPTTGATGGHVHLADAVAEVDHRLAVLVVDARC